jgi:hypothetical protein
MCTVQNAPKEKCEDPVCTKGKPVQRELLNKEGAMKSAMILTGTPLPVIVANVAWMLL